MDENSIDLSESIIDETWRKIAVGPIGTNTKIIKFAFGTLTIRASNPVWRNELSLRKIELLNRLNDELEKIKIKDIRFI